MLKYIAVDQRTAIRKLCSVNYSTCNRAIYHGDYWYYRR